MPPAADTRRAAPAAQFSHRIGNAGMNITTTFDASALSRPLMTSLGSVAAITRRGLQQLVRAPMLVWSLVLAGALLAFFVHLLNAQVLRGEQLREQQRAAAIRSPGRLPMAGTADGSQQPGNALLGTRQPIARP